MDPLGPFSQEKANKVVSGRRVFMIQAHSVGSERPITAGVQVGGDDAWRSANFT